MTELLFFLYFGGMTIVSSVLTVGLRSPVYCALALLSTLLHVAGLFVLLQAEFVAALQVIVYAGAVLVLYIFVIMLLDLKTAEKFFHKQVWVAVFFGVVLIFEILIGLFKSPLFTSAPRVVVQTEPLLGNTAEIGIALFTKYLLPFEIVGIILLGAVVGALVLAKKVPAS